MDLVPNEKFFYGNNISIESARCQERKQGSRFDQKQTQTQAASQILDLIFGPAYGKLQISRKSSAKRTHSIYKNKRTHLNDPSEKKSLKVSSQQEIFYENNTSIKSHRCQERNKDRDSIRNRPKHKLGLSRTKRSIT